MAKTPSAVRVALNSIATLINTEREAMLRAEQRFSTAVDNLGGIPTTFADAIEAISLMSPSDGEFEANCIAEKNALQAEFISLKTKANQVLTLLSDVDLTS